MTVAVKNVLYTAEVVVEGGRDGHARSSDGRLDVELDTPSDLEGSGGPGTNPEQLFAAAFSACFQSALEGIARGRNLDVSGSTITARVGVGPVADGGFGLEVRLELDAPSLSDEDAAALMTRAHKRCPVLARDRRQRPGGAGRERLDHSAGRLEQLQYGLVVVPRVDVAGHGTGHRHPRRDGSVAVEQLPDAAIAVQRAELGRQLAGERERMTWSVVVLADRDRSVTPSGPERRHGLGRHAGLVAEQQHQGRPVLAERDESRSDRERAALLGCG